MNTRVAESFQQQVDVCESLGSPFTAAILRAAAGLLGADDPVMRAVAGYTENPVAHALPLRFVGALHALVLTGADAELAALYPPNPAPDAARIAAVLPGVLARHRDHLLDWLTRPPQTNEVARSAVLILGFAHAHRLTGLPLSPREIGASAGLNLHWDGFAYHFGDAQWGGDSGVRLAPAWTGAAPRLPTTIPVADRAGADRHRIDPADPAQVLKLAAYVWADQLYRLERLRAAIAIAAAAPERVERIDAADFVEREFAAPVPGRCRVLYHSLVWSYLDQETRRRIDAAIEAAGARATIAAPIAHVSFELVKEGGARLVVRLWPGGRAITLASADPHGRAVTYDENGLPEGVGTGY